MASNRILQEVNTQVQHAVDAGPDVHHGVGHEHRCFNYKFPAPNPHIPYQPLAGSGQDLHGIIGGQMRPA